MGTDRSLRYTEHHLKADERPRTRYEYIVTGRGEFPWDMLRYDRCWPMSSSDVAKLDATLARAAIHPDMFLHAADAGSLVEL